MSDEKRNHPRAKVLSMTVRYKSATVDDFVEHHSDNVSRGGIFIKTTSPFPPGTLLKFEIRIAQDEAVLAGVGRVVWKRDEPGDEDDEPAGMGVKFIKLDEKSRALIVRLSERADGKESKYDKGFEDAPKKKKGVGKGTLLGLGAIGDDEIAEATAKAKAEDNIKADADDKEGEGGFFPKTDPDAEQPPEEERTVMKQAAELLEQALEGAGGSMDELGDPDSETLDARDDSVPAKAPAKDDADEEAAPAKSDAPDAASEPPVSRPPSGKPSAPPSGKPSAPPSGKPSAPPSGKPSGKPADSQPAPKAVSAAPRQAADLDDDEGGGNGLKIVVVLAVVAVIAYLLMSKDSDNSSTAPSQPTTSAAAIPDKPAADVDEPTNATESAASTDSGSSDSSDSSGSGISASADTGSADTASTTAATADPSAKKDDDKPKKVVPDRPKPKPAVRPTPKPAAKPATKPLPKPRPAPKPRKPPPSDDPYD